MSYIFPDEETLAKYLCLLSKVLILARHSAYSSDPKMAQLLDAVHNVPDLLARWKDAEECWVLAELEAYEARHCDGSNPFSSILKNGAESNWQLEWRAKEESKENGN